MLIFDPVIHMWVTFAVIIAAIYFYTREDVPLEITSLAVIGGLLLFFYIAPLPAQTLDPFSLLRGFADPALIAIVALLVVGQGLVQTGALDAPAQNLIRVGQTRPALTILGTLVIVLVTSAFLNNTPVVVIFIPIMAVMMERLRRSPSRIMIPLSYAAILGGMTTLIGSSTNLLVAGSLEDLTGDGIGFFDFSLLGLCLAGIGLLYVLFVAPLLLPKQASRTALMDAQDGKQYIAEIDVQQGGPLQGQKAVSGLFPGLPDMSVRLIQRGEKALLPPYDDVVLQPGDAVIVSATRAVLSEFVSHHPDTGADLINSGQPPSAPVEDDENIPAGSRMLAELMVAPASRLDGRTLALSGFRFSTRCIVLGIQRRSRMLRTSINDIRLEAGDVLLISGKPDDVYALRDNPDVLLLEASAKELPKRAMARRARFIFAGVVTLAAFDILPIAISALLGVVAMLAARCLNIRQASRAVDRRVVLIVAAALAMGTALQVTGGAAYLAMSLIDLLADAGLVVMFSAFFLLVALLTNVLSNNATAVLFTPIAVNLADRLAQNGLVPLDQSDLRLMFIYGVIFAANCSFATPMAYQTNLLVMGPGHYQFRDFMRAGTPLIIVIWIAATLLLPAWFGLL